MQTNLNIQHYQQRALSAQENVPYSQIVKSVYGPTGAIKREPFVGFKILLKDPYGLPITTERLDVIDHYLKNLFGGTGCIMRQTDNKVMPDGYYLITMPRPGSQVVTAINSVLAMMMALNQYLGFVKHELGTVEINVSGMCEVGAEPTRLSNLIVPDRYQRLMMQPQQSIYKFGIIERINGNYMLLRTRWNIASEMTMHEDMTILSQLLSVIF